MLPDHDLTQLGETLRESRETRAADDRRAFSLRALAGRLGISPTYLSALERGKQRPTETLLRTLASELGTTPEPLLALAHRVPDDVASSIASRPALAEAVRALRDLSDTDLARAVRRIRDGDW